MSPPLLRKAGRSIAAFLVERRKAAEKSGSPCDAMGPAPIDLYIPAKGGEQR